MPRMTFLLAALVASARLPAALPAQAPLAPAEAPLDGAERRILVVCDDDYPPYAFRNADGLLQGIVVDGWEAWQAETGIEVTLQGMDWSGALEAMRTGKADVIDTIFRNAERDTWLDFTPPWAELSVPIFFHEDISGIANARDLRGFRVAVKEGDACIDVLRSHGVTDLRFYPSYDAIVAAAVAGSEKVFCIDEPPALYLLGKAGASGRFRKALNLYTGYFHRAVAKGDAGLLDRINRGFAALGKERLEEIQKRWFGSTLGDKADPRLLWGLGIAAALALLLAANLALAAAFLRKRVAERTEELAEKVSQLTESEARTKAIVDALPDMLFVFDEDARFLEFQASSAIDPALPPSVFLGRTVAEVFGNESLHAQTQSAIRSALAGHEVVALQYPLRVGGEERVYEARMVALGQGRVLCVDRDVTERENAAAAQAGSLREKEALLREIHHRVKNNLQIVSSLLALQAERFKDPWDTMLFLESQSRIRAMAQVHEQLYRSDDFASIPAGDYLSDLVGEICMMYRSDRGPGASPVGFRVDSDGSKLELEQAVPVGLIVNELATNAFKYAFGDDRGGEVTVSVATEADGGLSLTVADDGAGFPEGKAPEQSGGMGYTIVQALVQQLGASLSTRNGPGGRGAVIELRVPAARMPQARGRPWS